MRRPLTAEGIVWNRKHATIWAARAEERRAAGGVLNNNIANALELVVRDLRAAIAAAAVVMPVEPAVAGELQQLEARFAVLQPTNYPGTNIMLGVGPICDGIRGDLRRRIAMLTGEPLAAEPLPAPPPVIVPPAEALPFTAGPQLDLFGLTA